MLKNIMELEEKYNIAIEDDGSYIYCYNNEFFCDNGIKKFHCAVINPGMDRVQIEYNHTISDYEFGFGVVTSVNGLKKFANGMIHQFCNHWSLYTPTEKRELIHFTVNVSTFIREVLTNEKEV